MFRNPFVSMLQQSKNETILTVVIIPDEKWISQLTLPAINDGGSWFNEGACHLNTATQAVEVPFPQAFASPKRSPFPSAPRYGMFLASSDRQSDREVGMRPPRRFYAAYHHCAHEHVDTLVLLPCAASAYTR